MSEQSFWGRVAEQCGGRVAQKGHLCQEAEGFSTAKIAWPRGWTFASVSEDLLRERPCEAAKDLGILLTQIRASR